MQDENHQHRTFQEGSMQIIKDSAASAGKAVIVMNGAAAIAILTKISPENDLTCALIIYAWSAVMGALVFAGTYFA